MIELRIKGIEQIAAELKKLAAKYPKAIAGALYQEGFDIWRESVKRAPVEFGVLRSSAYVSPPTATSSGVPRVEIGFGTNYAIPQHERLDYKHPRGGRAKYLQSVLEEMSPSMLARVARRTKALADAGTTITELPAPKRPRVLTGARKKGLRKRAKDRAREKRRTKLAKKKQERADKLARQKARKAASAERRAAGAKDRALAIVAAKNRKKRAKQRRNRKERRRRAKARKALRRAEKKLGILSDREREKLVKEREDKEGF